MYRFEAETSTNSAARQLFVHTKNRKWAGNGYTLLQALYNLCGLGCGFNCTRYVVCWGGQNLGSVALAI